MQRSCQLRLTAYGDRSFSYALALNNASQVSTLEIRPDDQIYKLANMMDKSYAMLEQSSRILSELKDPDSQAVLAANLSNMGEVLLKIGPSTRLLNV